MTAAPFSLVPDDAHNRALVENVRPPRWTNPQPSGRYNLVVVGGGTAGLVAATGAALLGAKVALVEKHLLGGDCLNYGCVPSKGILAAARVATEAKDAGGFGVRAGGTPEVDFPAVMERMRRLRAGISAHDSAARLSGFGVDVFIGAARFTARDAVEAGGRTLRFARAVIATGARAANLPIPGLAEAGFLTNETIFSVTSLPRRLIVIGGGPVGCELAQAFRRFGAEVAIVSREPRLLPREDVDAAALLDARFRREGIRLMLGAAIERVARRGGDKIVVFDRGEVAGDEILLAVGRAPNVEGLGLDAAGVASTAHGVSVDDRLRTTNRHIFAAGDICSSYKFTHAADAMARLVLVNALFFGRQRVSRLVIPWCTYTDPEVAHVGLNEADAKAHGPDVATFTIPLQEIDRAVLEGDVDGFARVHAERGSGRVLGATLVARHAGEMIGEMSLAITAGLRLGTLGRTVHPYPTEAEIWKRAADDWNRARLTARARRILAWFMAWRR